MSSDKWNNWNSGFTPKYPHNKLIQFMFRSYHPKERNAIKVLDLGCGSGVNTVFLSKENFKVFATDISPIGVENTKNLLASERLSIESISIESIANISYPDNFFDCVISIGVFDAAGKTEAFKSIKEINRVLKVGGKSFIVFAANDDFRMQNNQFNIHGYSEMEVKELLAFSEFKKVYVDHYSTTYLNQAQLQHDYIITLFK